MVASISMMRAAVLLAATATQVSALGSTVVHNQCDFPVYLWSVGSVGGSMETLAANGGAWSQQYQSNPDGGGISIKLGADTSCTNITQFEYTLDTSSLWYDLSNINGYPFAQWGVTVVPSDSTCRGVACPAGTPLCAAAYNVPSDNYATAECGSNADAVVVLCSGETDTSGSASISSVASVAASTVSASTLASSSSVVAQPTTTTQAAPTTSQAAPSTSTTSSVVAPTTSTTQQPAPTTTSSSSSKPTTHSHHSHPPHSTQAAIASPPAAPAVTVAPSAPAPEAANPYVVIETTFVTHVVTVEARSPKPTAEAKRDVHHHGHAAVHKEHLAPRHQHARNFAKH